MTSPGCAARPRAPATSPGRPGHRARPRQPSPGPTPVICDVSFDVTGDVTWNAGDVTESPPPPARAARREPSSRRGPMTSLPLTGRPRAARELPVPGRGAPSRFPGPAMGDLILNVDLTAPERRPKKERGNRKHQSFVRRRRELERRGVLRQKQLPPNRGGPQRTPAKPPRSCPKENGSAGTGVPSKTKGKGRGAAGGTPESTGAPSAPQNGRAKTKGRARGAVAGAPPAPTKLLAMDCEMVGTGPGGRTSALARCSIVSYDGDVVYDRYVRPEAPIAGGGEEPPGLGGRERRGSLTGLRGAAVTRHPPTSASRRLFLRLLLTPGTSWPLPRLWGPPSRSPFSG
ncbi:interferon-stimulated 20 kDa exonuclease-like 2 [Neopelma chrysocephalum]|uniref:interferon-stimulated 20 kDa exonuclease-like 2 n=1 Tax=Neopelma chrysocephalum TaxID=114329 RepID=UPI000FCD0818|nr:interferon-stimulated 20 kDa exonuclease-like 2 [Neopelma chrysocephalum]